MVVIIANYFQHEENASEAEWAGAYIGITFIAMFILNYIVAKEYKDIFMLEKQGAERN
jgi:hypothetical protein